MLSEREKAEMMTMGYMMKGAVSEMPQDAQDEIKSMQDKIMSLYDGEDDESLARLYMAILLSQVEMVKKLT